MPTDPIDRLRRKLERAVKDENYEEAAKVYESVAVILDILQGQSGQFADSHAGPEQDPDRDP